MVVTLDSNHVPPRLPQHWWHLTEALRMQGIDSSLIGALVQSENAVAEGTVQE